MDLTLPKLIARPLSGDLTEVWSCGGGTQSGAIAVLIAEGKIPKPDIAFMTDTGRERSSTWPFVDGHFWLHPACVPLAQVDFFAQTTMFSERGCTGGCFT